MPEEKVGSAPTTAPSDVSSQSHATENKPSETVAPTQKGSEGNTNSQAKPNQVEDAGAKKLTQDEVNEIVKGRIKDTESKFLKHFGVNDLHEIDNQLAEGKQAKQELILSKNNIAQGRYDDVITHFKGKGQELTAESLAEAIKTHPEWVGNQQAQTNVITAKSIGAEKSAPNGDSELDWVEKVFGVRPKKVK